MALSGHGCFTRHRYLQGKTKEERCAFCLSDPENAEHFICHCPVFTSHRLKYLGPNTSLHDACRPENIPQLVQYLRVTGRASFFPEDLPEDPEMNNAVGTTDPSGGSP